MMTPIAAILAQRDRLCRSALRRTADVNEAYLAVHAVIAYALSNTGKRDLDRDLSCALDKRAAALCVSG